ncbi:MAG: hypothetical protein R3B09_26765 [Nannocystaceae bacterium]
MQSLFKIEGVLTGDSRVVALEGRDAADRRVRIELPAAEAGTAAIGSVLVVQWWMAELPGDASAVDGSTSRMGSTPAETARMGAAPVETTRTESAPESSTGASVTERVEAEFRRLMGLR